MEFQANPGRQLTIRLANGAEYNRIPVKTHIITDKDDIVDVVRRCAGPFLRPRDVIFISERVVAITQGRAFPIEEIHPSWLARLLVKFVHKSPYGIGLGSPWTMELAIREAGAGRILLGAFAAALTKPFGLRGTFYRVVGKNINAIDGPCSYTLPPYNNYAKLGPRDPNRVAREIQSNIGVETVIIDANDLGVTVLGKSAAAPDQQFCKRVFHDNPLGQTNEQTPIGIVRRVE